MVTNKLNGKRYIGQTIHDLNTRKKQHISAALTKKDNIYFHSTIRKYGQDNFEWIILHDNIIDIDLLNRLEIYYIGYYDTFENGYNLTLGGKGINGLKHKTVAKQKMSKSRIGMKFSEEHKKKISEAQLGKKNHMYGKTGESCPNYGLKRSIKTRKKLSELRKGKNNPVARAVIIDNKYFDTVRKAAEFAGVSFPTIRDRILHKTKWTDYQYA